MSEWTQCIPSKNILVLSWHARERQPFIDGDPYFPQSVFFHGHRSTVGFLLAQQKFSSWSLVGRNIYPTPFDSARPARFVLHEPLPTVLC